MPVQQIPPRNVGLITPPPCKRYGYHAITDHLRDHRRWPDAEISGLSEEAKERFERLQRGIKIYLDSNGSLALALEEAKCSKGVLYRQLQRCLQPIDSLGTIAGWTGIIANLRLKPYARVNTGEGTAGKFEQWFTENPAWRDQLHQLIHKGGGGKKIAAAAPTVRGVAGAFIAKIKEKIPEGQYPHLPSKNGGIVARRSVERYISHYVKDNLKTTKVWYGKKVADRQHIGTGHDDFVLAAAPFDMVGCDAHHTDCIGVLTVDGPAGPQRIPVTRLKIVVLICHFTRCVSGYSVCIESQVSALDIEKAYLMGTQKWSRKELAIGDVKYAPNAGFPCGSVEGLDEVNFGGIQLDNAAQHFAKGIQQRLRTSVGCMVSWGGVGHWWRNAVVERFFKTLESRGFKRLPSTMGTGTQDPHRGDPMTEAVGHGIEAQELLQLLDVLIANYNGAQHTSLGGRSPLQVVRDHMPAHRPRWVPRMRPPYGATTLRPGIEIVQGTINGYVQSRVSPYVELDRARYTNPALATRYDLIGRHVWLHVPLDMRFVEAFLDDGTPLGELRCLHKGWSMSPHSREIRKAINALIDGGQLAHFEGGNPVAAYLDYLSDKAAASTRTGGQPKVSGAASAAAEVQRQSSVGPSRDAQTEATAVSTSPPPPRPAPAAANVPAYEPRRRLVGVTLPKKWK